jgi:hypothetical protein
MTLSTVRSGIEQIVTLVDSSTSPVIAGLQQEAAAAFQKRKHRLQISGKYAKQSFQLKMVLSYVALMAHWVPP